jgi:integrase
MLASCFLTFGPERSETLNAKADNLVFSDVEMSKHKTGRRPGSWDEGLDFEWARKELLRIYGRVEGKEKVYAAALLIQLVNGLRVREALRALQYFLETRERSFYLEPGKRGSPRPVRIPSTIRYREEWKWILQVPGDKARKRLHYYSRKWLNTNTHSLRYALVGYLAKKGVAAQIIAKITGHKKLDRILQYTQLVRAEEVLESIAS